MAEDRVVTALDEFLIGTIANFLWLFFLPALAIFIIISPLLNILIENKEEKLDVSYIINWAFEGICSMYVVFVYVIELGIIIWLGIRVAL